MDSILINPKDAQDLKYLMELMRSMEVPTMIISEDEREDFELARMMKQVDTSAIIREDTKPVSLKKIYKNLLELSEDDIKEKRFVTEFVIQTEEDEWLNE